MFSKVTSKFQRNLGMSRRGEDTCSMCSNQCDNYTSLDMIQAWHMTKQRREMFTEAFDANLSIAAAPCCQVEEESRRKRQCDDVLELMEQKRESEAFEPPPEAFSDTWKG